MTLEWSEDLAVGHPKIDQQHQELIQKFNDFLDACNARHGKDQLGELYQFLDDYVILHFHAEEDLMARYNYPGAMEHRAEHRDFTNRLAGLRSDLEQVGPTVHVLIRTNKALLYWLTNHIKKIDVKLAQFLQEQND